MADGRIRTENSSLISMLREQSSESQRMTRRVYVDTPELPQDDDGEKYRFVSVHPENFDESHEEALTRPRQGDQQRTMETGDQRQPSRHLSAESKYSDRQYPGNTHPDGQGPRNRQPSGDDRYTDTQFVVHSAGKSQVNKPLSHFPPVVTPIRRPARSQTEEELRREALEEQELLEEEAYQTHLKTALKDTDNLITDVDSRIQHVEDQLKQEYEDGPLPDDSLDPGYHYNHRQDDGDSLEGDDYPRHGSSMSYGRTDAHGLPPQQSFHIEDGVESGRHEQNPFSLHNSHTRPLADPSPREDVDSRLGGLFPGRDQPGPSHTGPTSHPHLNTHNKQPFSFSDPVSAPHSHQVPPAAQPAAPHNVQTSHQMPLQAPPSTLTGHPAAPVAHVEQAREQYYQQYLAESGQAAGGVTGYVPDVPRGDGSWASSQSGQQPPPLPHTQWPSSGGQPPPLPHTQWPSSGAQPPPLPHTQWPGSGGQWQQPAAAGAVETAGHSNQFAPRAGPAPSQTSAAQSPRNSSRLTDKPPKPLVDYVQKNKQKTGKEKKRYGEIFAQKKEIKEQMKNPAPRERRASQGDSRHSPAAVSNSPGVPDVNPPQGASVESLWSQQTRNLAQRKDEKQSGKKRKGLNKYNSDSQLNRPSHGVSNAPVTTQAPQAGQPSAGQPSVGQPIRTTVLTEDGQRVSVDINLKVVSPPPGQPLDPRHPHAHPYANTANTQPLQRPHYNTAQSHNNTQQAYYPPHGGHQQHQPVAYQQPPAAYQQMPVGYQQPSAGYHQQQPGAYQQPPPGAYQQPPYNTSHPAAYHNPAYRPAGSDSFTKGAVDTGYQTPSTAGSNPYPVLPPITSIDTQQPPHEAWGSQSDLQRSPRGHQNISPRREGGGSYAEQFQKLKEPAKYQVYTLQDFRRLKQEVRLGGLGPDTDNPTTKERKEKVQRQSEYARQIAEKNRQDYLAQNTRPNQRHDQRDVDLEEEAEAMNRRRMALDYARSVPKPKVAPQPAPRARNDGRAARTAEGAQQARNTINKQKPNSSPGTYAAPVPRVEATVPRVDLEDLQARHQRERAQAEAIRQRVQV